VIAAVVVVCWLRLMMLLSWLLRLQQLLLLELLWHVWPLLAEGHQHRLQNFDLTAAGVWQSAIS
jgi:hypothetical protein